MSEMGLKLLFEKELEKAAAIIDSYQVYSAQKENQETKEMASFCKTFLIDIELVKPKFGENC